MTVSQDTAARQLQIQPADMNWVWNPWHFKSSCRFAVSSCSYFPSAGISRDRRERRCFLFPSGLLRDHVVAPLTDDRHSRICNLENYGPPENQTKEGETVMEEARDGVGADP